MKIIDCHYHNDRWMFDGEDYFTALKKYREIVGVETINLLCMPGYENGFYNGGAAQNIMGAILKKEDASVFAFGGLIYPSDGTEFDPVSQAKDLMAIGFDGIKMIESKPTSYVKLPYRIDSEHYKEFFVYAEAQQIPILSHVADPEDFWDPERAPEIAKKNGWFYGDGCYPSREQIYGEIYTILKRHPKLKIIFPHCFFLSRHPAQLEELLDTYENVCIDLTPGSEMYLDFSANREVWQRIFHKYYHRFMFGTDIHSVYDVDFRKQKVENVVRFFTTDDVFSYFGKTVHGLGLTQEQCDYIFGKSFLAFMSGNPKRIAPDALNAYITCHIENISDEEAKNMILQYRAEKL